MKFIMGVGVGRYSIKYSIDVKEQVCNWHCFLAEWWWGGRGGGGGIINYNIFGVHGKASVENLSIQDRKLNN